MVVFTVPAAYERYVAAELALTLARIGEDVHWRANEDERVRAAFACVPDAVVDWEKSGRVAIIVGVTVGSVQDAVGSRVEVAA